MMPERLHNDYKWTLSSLLEGITETYGQPEAVVTSLCLDSRDVCEGAVFIALQGEKGHGAEYIGEAISRGAAAVLWEHSKNADFEVHGLKIPVIAVPELRQRLGAIADRFYHHPSQHMTVIGVTGTDGKTSVTHFIAQALNEDQSSGSQENDDLFARSCGIIGTLGYGMLGALSAGIHTTPDSIRLHAELARLRDAGVKNVAIEASSHGLEQGRLNAVAVDIAVLTNLSRDHLDYHQSPQAYARAKRRLFEIADVKHAVINLDDAFGKELIQQLDHGLSGGLEITAYSSLEQTGYAGEILYATSVEAAQEGLYLHIETPEGKIELQSSLMGRFNASNLLAVMAVLRAMGMSSKQAAARIAGVRTVPGRMQALGSGPVAIVDYAHTPAALQSVLVSLREHCAGRLWCVFGCGGDRDTGKRPVMGSIAQKHADICIITDDNPRTESPQEIVEDILSGLATRECISVIHDRRQAILYALNLAASNDMVLIAGKGHETTQTIGDQVHLFDDAKVVSNYFEEHHK